MATCFNHSGTICIDTQHHATQHFHLVYLAVRICLVDEQKEMPSLTVLTRVGRVVSCRVVDASGLEGVWAVNQISIRSGHCFVRPIVRPLARIASLPTDRLLASTTRPLCSRIEAKRRSESADQRGRCDPPLRPSQRFMLGQARKRLCRRYWYDGVMG